MMSAKAKTRAPRPVLLATCPAWPDAIADLLRQEYGTKERKTQAFVGSALSMLSQWAEAQPLSVAEFRARHLREYLAYRKDVGRSERTIHHDAIIARVFTRFCAREGYIPSDPLKDYRIPRAEQAYVHCPTETEARRLLDAIPRRWQPSHNDKAHHTPVKSRTFLARRDYAIVAGLLDTSCRIGELLALHVKDIELDTAQPQIIIRKSKANRPRILPVSREWCTAVQSYLRVRPSCDCPNLFITRNGSPINVSTFGHSFPRYLEYAGLSGFTLHGLRHYAVSIMSDAAGYETARVMAGHSSVVTTQIYVHQRAAQLRAGHDEAAPLRRLLVNTRTEAQRRKRLPGF